MDRVEMRRRILEANDAQAARLRDRFSEREMLVVDLVSSPGSGKTTLLESMARRNTVGLQMATIVGDIATERDADRLRALDMPAHQIVTGGACHLDARLVTDALDACDFELPELLFIENVGNLVCPASYDLGEDFKVVLLSVTEGHDKPMKYPSIFSRANVTLITKADLRPHVDFDVELVRAQLMALNPEAELIILSSKTGEGMDEWENLLATRRAAKRTTAGSSSS